MLRPTDWLILVVEEFPNRGRGAVLCRSGAELRQVPRNRQQVLRSEKDICPKSLNCREHYLPSCSPIVQRLDRFLTLPEDNDGRISECIALRDAFNTLSDLHKNCLWPET